MEALYKHSLPKEPLVSVILPTYNRRQFIGESIESVLNQSYRNIELIVVDDGSTDGTDELVHAISPRIRYFRQANAGVAAARNRGLAAAQGELMAFQDSDDLWHPEKLSLQVALLQHNPCAGMTYTSHRIIDCNGRVIGGRWKQLHSGRVTEELFKSMFIIMPSTLVRRSVVDRVGQFNTSLCTNSDYEFWLRASLYTDFLAIEADLVDERQSPCRLTSAKGDSATLQYNMLSEFYHNMGGTAAIRQEIASRALAKSAYRAGRALGKEGRFAAARQMLVKSLGHRFTCRAATRLIWSHLRHFIRQPSLFARPGPRIQLKIDCPSTDR
jgi:glycosyltransferase involved in cell wall biosynthesis